MFLRINMKKERSFQAKKRKNTLQKPNPKRLMDTEKVTFQLNSKCTISAYTTSLRILVPGKNGHATFKVKMVHSAHCTARSSQRRVKKQPCLTFVIRVAAYD
jgi:uncharacterized protein YydD (DUF2326 family)